jgi:hypothetical protein
MEAGNVNPIHRVAAIWDRPHHTIEAEADALEKLKAAIHGLRASDLPPVISHAFDLTSSGRYRYWIVYATATIEHHSRALACQHCASEVRGFAGARWRYRVIHADGCPWYRRHRAGEDPGQVPCGAVVTHRGPYKRRPAYSHQAQL